ncbi:hypothetical protein IW261DRAFT_1590165 [Armillaria novae-zelandiae]|uniref:Uncharacterized protein n=1 Tax=Armillaria novae-zelandiae TaxID=153914 RepID=A0AA39UHQ2_9AGAR|nr:hypothetical protein IW261DRAFT_1590165 [Armillaria novae-zelandiae]
MYVVVTSFYVQAEFVEHAGHSTPAILRITPHSSEGTPEEMNIGIPLSELRDEHSFDNKPNHSKGALHYAVEEFEKQTPSLSVAFIMVSDLLGKVALKGEIIPEIMCINLFPIASRCNIIIHLYVPPALGRHEALDLQISSQAD